jgi:hypothetical protein
MRIQASRLTFIVFLTVTGLNAFSQQSPDLNNSPAQTLLERNARQTARALGMDPNLRKLLELRTQRLAGEHPTLEEIAIRQELLESVEAATLDVDSVIAELTNEQSRIGSIRSALEVRRDRKVNRLPVAALVTGSGAGTAVSATQFTPLGSTIQNVGDGVGIASGAATTILSILAARAQNGPRSAVLGSPNMLAPLLGGTPVLNTNYPPIVLNYLKTVPAGEDPSRGTRLEQLIAQWDRAGLLASANPAVRDQKITHLTSGGDSSVTSSIEELTERIAMLGDVRGVVSLLKRDLATIIRVNLRSPS